MERRDSWDGVRPLERSEIGANRRWCG